MIGFVVRCLYAAVGGQTQAPLRRCARRVRRPRRGGVAGLLGLGGRLTPRSTPGRRSVPGEVDLIFAQRSSRVTAYLLRHRRALVRGRPGDRLAGQRRGGTRPRPRPARPAGYILGEGERLGEDAPEPLESPFGAVEEFVDRVPRGLAEHQVDQPFEGRFAGGFGALGQVDLDDFEDRRLRLGNSTERRASLALASSSSSPQTSMVKGRSARARPRDRLSRSGSSGVTRRSTPPATWRGGSRSGRPAAACRARPWARGAASGARWRPSRGSGRGGPRACRAGAPCEANAARCWQASASSNPPPRQTPCSTAVVGGEVGQPVDDLEPLPQVRLDLAGGLRLLDGLQVGAGAEAPSLPLRPRPRGPTRLPRLPPGGRRARGRRLRRGGCATSRLIEPERPDSVLAAIPPPGRSCRVRGHGLCLSKSVMISEGGSRIHAIITGSRTEMTSSSRIASNLLGLVGTTAGAILDITRSGGFIIMDSTA